MRLGFAVRVQRIEATSQAVDFVREEQAFDEVHLTRLAAGRVNNLGRELGAAKIARVVVRPPVRRARANAIAKVGHSILARHERGEF